MQKRLCYTKSQAQYVKRHGGLCKNDKTTERKWGQFSVSGKRGLYLDIKRNVRYDE